MAQPTGAGSTGSLGLPPPESQPPLRVLEVSTRYFPDMGGTESHVHEVTTRMAHDPGLALTVFASDRSGRLPRADAGEGFAIVRRRAYPAKRDYYFAPGLPAVITRGRWDLIHFQGVHTFVPILGMLAARASRTPYVLTFHTGGHSSSVRSALRDAQWRVLRPLLRGARLLIAVGPSERAYFERVTGLPPERFTVIRNGGSLPPAPGDVAVVPGRILSSGRLERYKGHHRAIEALAEVRRTVPEAHLVILGSGPYEAQLRELAAARGVADAVEIRAVPPSDRAAMSRELAAAAVMAALSDYEAHPVAIMEAVALGLPVVGTDAAGTGDLVAEGLVTGVAPDADAATIARQLVTTMAAGRGAAPEVTLPTWDECAAALAAVYRHTAGTDRRTAGGSRR